MVGETMDASTHSLPTEPYEKKRKFLEALSSLRDSVVRGLLANSELMQTQRLVSFPSRSTSAIQSLVQIASSADRTDGFFNETNNALRERATPLLASRLKDLRHCSVPRVSSSSHPCAEVLFVSLSYLLFRLEKAF